MTTDGLPDVIDTYQRAHDRDGIDTALGAFASDATVADDGASYTGTDAIRGWLDHAASEYTITRTLAGFDDLGEGRFVVHNHLTSNFPSGEVDLRYRFVLGDDDLIRQLDIAPCASPPVRSPAASRG